MKISKMNLRKNGSQVYGETGEEEKLTPVIGNYISKPIEPYIVKPKSIEVKYDKVESSSSPMFSTLYPKHLEEMRKNRRRETTINETEGTYEDIIELFGDKPISEYTNIDGRDLKWTPSQGQFFS